jgi:hypothetical protein
MKRLIVCLVLLVSFMTYGQDSATAKKNLFSISACPYYYYIEYYDGVGKWGELRSLYSSGFRSLPNISLSYERNFNGLSVGLVQDFPLYYPKPFMTTIKYFFTSCVFKYRKTSKNVQIAPILQLGIRNFDYVNPFAGIGTQFEYKRVILSARYFHVFIPDNKIRFYVHEERLFLFGIGLKLGSLPR